MDKTEVFLKLISKAKNELQQLESALENVKAGVNSPESKQEGKYDTRALLDSYLAGGQEVRIKQLKTEIKASMQSITKQKFARIITLKDQKNLKTKHYFLSPYLGGYTIDLPQGKIQTITPKTPLAILLSDKEVDDEVEEGVLAGYVVQDIL